MSQFIESSLTLPDGTHLSIDLPSDYARIPLVGFSAWIAYLEDPTHLRGIGMLHRVIPETGQIQECCLGAKRTVEGAVWSKPNTVGQCVDSQYNAVGQYHGPAALSLMGDMPHNVRWLSKGRDVSRVFVNLASLNDSLPGQSFEPLAWVIEQFWCEP